MNNQNSEPKSDSPKCDCETQTLNVFLTCAGASNCGQIANQAAIKLTEEGVGKLYCLAGIGSHNQGMMESVKSADRIVVLDGCPTACAKKTTEHAGITVTDWVCITQLGIKKEHHFNIKPEETAKVAQSVKTIMSGS